MRGLGHRVQQDYTAAIAACQQALALDRTLNPESADVASDLNTLAAAERLSGDYAAAERDYTEALRIAQQVNYREGVAYITGNLAELALDREDWPTTARLAREALGLAETLGRLELVGAHCQRLATALARQGQPQEGLPYARRAMEIYTRLKISPDEMEAAQAALRDCEAGG